MTESSATHDAAIALMRALIDEVRAAAHDPAVIHLVAEKLKAGVDSLEQALTEQKTEDKKRRE